MMKATARIGYNLYSFRIIERRAHGGMRHRTKVTHQDSSFKDEVCTSSDRYADDTDWISKYHWTVSPPDRTPTVFRRAYQSS